MPTSCPDLRLRDAAHARRVLLLVEDERLRAALRAHLCAAGWIVHAAEGARDALRALHDPGAPPLVVAEADARDLDVFGLLAAATAIAPRLAAVLCARAGSLELLEPRVLRALGVAAAVTIPCSLHTIGAQLEALVADRAAAAPDAEATVAARVERTPIPELSS